MAAIQRHHLSRTVMTLGGILTLVWGGALAWLALACSLWAAGWVGSLFIP